MAKKLKIVPDLANLNFMRLDKAGYRKKKKILSEEVKHIKVDEKTSIANLVDGMKNISRPEFLVINTVGIA